jgi:hypothetical protein
LAQFSQQVQESQPQPGQQQQPHVLPFTTVSSVGFVVVVLIPSPPWVARPDVIARDLPRDTGRPIDACQWVW